MIDNYITIEKFKTNLLNTINACGLTVGCAYYVLKDVLNDLKNYYEKDALEEATKEQVEELNINTLTGEVTKNEITEE